MTAVLTQTQMKAQEIATRSPYGWGHTIEFPGFTMPGILGTAYQTIIENLTTLGWLPENLSGKRVADIGCFSGGMTKLLADRGAFVVGVEEIPEHLEQAELVVQSLDLTRVGLIRASLYELRVAMRFDIVLCSGVLYHLSDMLVGLKAMRDLLEPDAVLLLESNAIDDMEHSYANYGRFYAGMWWQPTSLCISDMCLAMGFAEPEIRFYEPGRCLVRTTASGEMPFKRGLNYSFADIHDERPRPMDARIMRPAR